MQLLCYCPIHRKFNAEHVTLLYLPGDSQENVINILTRLWAGGQKIVALIHTAEGNCYKASTQALVPTQPHVRWYWVQDKPGEE